MITKETARRIYNCYQQIEEIDRLKKEMLEEVEKIVIFTHFSPILYEVTEKR